jgi:hypothetical protein
MNGSGKTPIYGPEPWITKLETVWSYWDLWFCVVALADHDGDLDALAQAIEDGGRSFWGGTVEAKLCHLDDLRRPWPRPASTLARSPPARTPTLGFEAKRGPRCSSRGSTRGT